jgi:hypothetical protein
VDIDPIALWRIVRDELPLMSAAVKRLRALSRAEVVEVNRAIARSAEDFVFFRQEEGWTKEFVAKHRLFRIEMAIEKVRMGNRVFTEAIQRLVERPPAEAEAELGTSG